MDALGSNEQLHPLLKTVRILEDHLGKGHTADRVMDDVLQDALDVAVSLGKVHSVQTRDVLSAIHTHAEHGAGQHPFSAQGSRGPSRWSASERGRKSRLE